MSPEEEAQAIADVVRPCATDEQYTDLVDAIAAALKAREAATGEAVRLRRAEYEKGIAEVLTLLDKAGARTHADRNLRLAFDRLVIMIASGAAAQQKGSE